jgi:hypothetical protein
MSFRLFHRHFRYSGWLLAGVLAVLQTGCASYSRGFEQEIQSLASHDPAAAIKVLDHRDTPERNILLYHLNKAMLLHMLGDYRASNAEFEQAKKVIARYQAVSVSEQTAAFFINDGTRTYIGSPLEQLMLHIFSALNYLMLDQVDDARVEALQIDVRLRELNEEDPNSILSIDPFARYLSAMIYEQLGEIDNAMIDYRKAYNAYQEHQKAYGIVIPEMLKYDLVRTSKQLGLNNEYRQYLKEFGLDAKQIDLRPFRNKGELVVLFLKDLAPIKRTRRVAQVDPSTGYLVHFSVPVYQRRDSNIAYARIAVQQKMFDTETVEDISSIAVKTLDEDMPAIMARALARAVVKYQMSRKAGEDNGLAGLMMNIVGVITEQADTRSWLTLPGEIQLARVPLPPGDYNVNVELVGSGGHVISTRKLGKVTIQRGEKQYLSYQWFPPYYATRR